MPDTEPEDATTGELPIAVPDPDIPRTPMRNIPFYRGGWHFAFTILILWVTFLAAYLIGYMMT